MVNRSENTDKMKMGQFDFDLMKKKDKCKDHMRTKHFE